MTRGVNRRGAAPIDWPSATAQVADRLRQAILDGVLSSPDWLTGVRANKAARCQSRSDSGRYGRLIQEDLLMNELIRGSSWF